MIAIRGGKDVIAGSLFSLLGIAALWFARDLEYGTARQMGSGFIPRWLAGILVLLGAVIALRGLLVESGRMTGLSLRPPTALLLAIVVFGLSIDTLGLVFSTFVCAVIASLAGGEARRAEMIVLGAGLAAFSGIVFVYGLRLPFSLWPVF